MVSHFNKTALYIFFQPVDNGLSNPCAKGGDEEGEAERVGEESGGDEKGAGDKNHDAIHQLGGGEVADIEFTADGLQGVETLLANEGGADYTGGEDEEYGGKKADNSVNFKEEGELENRQPDEDEE